MTNKVANQKPQGSDEKVVTLVTSGAPAPIVRLKDVIDRAADRSGLKRKDIKPAIEAALAVLADAIEKGEDLRIPPLGKVKVARSRDVPGGKMITLKLRTGGNVGGNVGGGAKDDDAPLADDED